MIRRIVEKLSRGRAFKRRLPATFCSTPIYVSPDAQLKYLKPGANAFDANLLAIARDHITQDSRVWDIGANVGVFAFAAASLAMKGSTLAVEADIWLAQLIKRSSLLKQNKGLNLQVLPAAICGRNGAASFFIAERGRASNCLEQSGGRSQTGGTREKVTIATLTLDTLLEFFDPPTFVKMDIEGAEVEALKGGQRLLSEVAPTVYVEVGTESNQEVTSILEQNGYLLFDGAKPLANQQPGSKCSRNTLAIPKRKLSNQRC